MQRGFSLPYKYQQVFVLVVPHAVTVFESSRKTGNGSRLPPNYAEGISG